MHVKEEQDQKQSKSWIFVKFIYLLVYTRRGIGGHAIAKLDES
jgi:hypothetical protein